MRQTSLFAPACDNRTPATRRRHFAEHMGRRRAERDARDAADASENAAAQPRLEAEATRIRREPTGHDAIGARIDAAQVRKRYAAAPAHAVWYESLPPCGCCPAETA